MDAQGKPQFVYHGTNAEFTAFKPSPTGALGAGIYLSGFNSEAGQYGDRVIDAYASIENPVTGTFAEFGPCKGRTNPPSSGRRA